MDHWQDLISPIRDDAPAGDDLSFSMEFDAIQEARRADDPTLDQGEWVTDIKYADWPGAAKQCRELLRNRTKDLRVASWLGRSQYPSCMVLLVWPAAIRLIAYFCDHYWDTVYPMMDQGDAEERVGNLVWLLTQSQQWLRTLPLVNAPQGRFGLNDFETVFSRAENTEQDPGDHPDQDQLQAARRDTSPDYYRRLLEEIPDCGAALRELRDAVDRHLGVDGPSFSAAEDLLTLLNQTVRRFARDCQCGRSRRRHRSRCWRSQSSDYFRHGGGQPGRSHPITATGTGTVAGRGGVLSPHRAAQPGSLPGRTRRPLGRDASASMAENSDQGRRHTVAGGGITGCGEGAGSGH